MSVNTSDLDAAVRFRNFNWEKARTFYIIAKLGSYSKAAVFLRISQSALSRQILDLEKSLDARLFIRESRGVKLTRKGEDLYSIVEMTFLGLKDFTRSTHAETNNGKKRKIRIAATHPFASYILHDPLINFSKIHPEFFFEVITDDHYIDLVTNDIDVAIRPYDEVTQEVIQEHLSTFEKKLFASKEYLEKFGEPKTIEDLKNHHIISHSQPERHPYSDVNWILRLGLPQGKAHDPVFSSNSVELLVNASQRGLGIIGIFEEMELIQKSGLIRILTNVKGPLNKDYIIYPKFLEKDQMFESFKNYLLHHFSRFRDIDL